MLQLWPHLNGNATERDHGTTAQQKRKHKFNDQKKDMHANIVSPNREIIQASNSTLP